VPRLTDRSGALIESQRREPSVLRTLGPALLGARRAGQRERWGEVVTDVAAYDTDRVVDWAEGSTQLISSDCWSACGPWDESFFLFSEETDFDLRARDAGFATQYVADARATHLEGGSAGSARLWPLVVANQVRLFRSRHGRAATVAFWAACLAREASRAALGRKRSLNAVRVLLSPRQMRATPGPDWFA
jgi:GT2 family glycosyltransferase